MPALTVLSAANNVLNGTVPVTDILSCRALTDLDLSSNYLTGVAPLDLVDLPGLYVRERCVSVPPVVCCVCVCCCCPTLLSTLARPSTPPRPPPFTPT